MLAEDLGPGREAGPGDIAAGSAQAVDKPGLDRIAREDHDDRDGLRRGLRGQRGRARGRDDHIHLESYQIGREGRQPLDVALGPAVLDLHVLPVDPAELAHPSQERGQSLLDGFARRGSEITDPVDLARGLRLGGMRCREDAAHCASDEGSAIDHRFLSARMARDTTSRDGIQRIECRPFDP